MGYNSTFLVQLTPQGDVTCQAAMKMQLGVESMAGGLGQSQWNSNQGAGEGAITYQEILYGTVIKTKILEFNSLGSNPVFTTYYPGDLDKTHNLFVS